MTQSEPDDTNCRFCPRNYSCGVLATELEILDAIYKSTNDPQLIRRIQVFLQELTESGFRQPAGNDFCALETNKEHLQRLIEQAQELLRGQH